MKLIQIKNLKFSLPDNLFDKNILKINKLTDELKSLSRSAGTKNKKFEKAHARLYRALVFSKDLVEEIDSAIMIRALARIMYTDISTKIHLTAPLLKKIDSLIPKPSTSLIQSIYEHYLKHYDKLDDPEATAKWLLNSIPKRNLETPYYDKLLGINGPKWLAQKAILDDKEFDNTTQEVELNKYTEGRYMTVAKQIYFVEQLRTIPSNKPHKILAELQKPGTFESRYCENYLLGHKILEILIERAPTVGVNDSWRNVVIAIGGDPRVSSIHPKHQKWWSQIDSNLRKKVCGWLSSLDLRLFLESIKNYSCLPNKSALKRMFPSRKRFLEGMFDKNLITHTRLYLNKGAEEFLRKNYKQEDLPEFSRVCDNNKSLIHVQIGDSHMIEGSHECYLRIYKYLSPSSVVFDYDKNNVSYYSLTQGMSNKMKYQGTPVTACISHLPTNFSWQRKAIKTLKSIGIKISMCDVLTDEDYKKYKRKFGVDSEWEVDLEREVDMGLESRQEDLEWEHEE